MLRSNPRIPPILTLVNRASLLRAELHPHPQCRSPRRGGGRVRQRRGRAGSAGGAVAMAALLLGPAFPVALRPAQPRGTSEPAATTADFSFNAGVKKT